MPPLPVVYGVMGLPSGVRAIMAEKPGQQSRSIRSGDTIGDFKVLALDSQTVKFEWNGKEVSRRIDELVDRSNPNAGNGPANSGPAAPPPPPATASANRPATAPPAALANATHNTDGSYTETDKEGRRWTLTPTPFGVMRVPDNRPR